MKRLGALRFVLLRPRRFVLACAVLVPGMAAICTSTAWAAGKAGSSHTPAAAGPAVPPPLPIGEINTYKALPAFAEPYRRGWTLALEQINAQGGVLGRKLVVRSRDDKGNPDDAVQAAQALVERDGVAALFGGYSSEVALALSRYADSAKVLYLAVAPLSQRLTWQEGNRYTFRLRPAAWMQAAAVAPKALGQRKLRWALVYQDTESDRATADAFKGLMRTFQSKTEFVAEQAVPPGKFNAESTVAALDAAKPEAIFNMLTGKDLASLARAGMAAHLLDNVAVVSLFTGDPDNLAILDAAIPDGWIITGYPGDAVDTAENKAFVQAYRDRYGEAPGTAAVLGYAALNSIAEGLKRAGAADREALVAAFPRLQVPTPFGTIEYRNLDHQSTLGIYLGYTGHAADGQLVMDRFVYASGTRLQPLDEQIRRLRVQASRAASGGSGAPGDAATATANPATNATTNPAAKSAAHPAGNLTSNPTANPVANPAGNPAADPAANPAMGTSGATTPRAPMGPAKPVTKTDNELTTRLRAARPGAAAAPPATGTSTAGTQGSQTSTPATQAPGPVTPTPGTESLIDNKHPAARALTPAMPNWPDEVGQPAASPGAATH